MNRTAGRDVHRECLQAPPTPTLERYLPSTGEVFLWAAPCDFHVAGVWSARKGCKGQNLLLFP